MNKFFRILSCVFFLGIGMNAHAQQKDVYVDKQGIMRWGATKQEVRAFGVNYTVPFAHAYRTAKRKNISLEKAIDEDVYHFARLGFDLYRVHVWDCEISDSVGNLLNNEHLKLFDYMLKKMKERGMKFVITPIAYWPNGYPEPEEKTPGFATKYGKDACLTNEDAIRAQENYLYQFLNHVNPYTGVAYKNDPDIIAFEISNEPHHQEAPQKVTTFIQRMMTSMKKTGSKKPVFYNISHSIHLADAYFDAGIQGGTFQWYPTGLGSLHELQGNLLPNVDKYTIPFAANPKFKRIGKLVYEFDAADVGRSYIYPAMARSFMEAGMQIATHFAYDPTYMADVNTEYNTHYMNLVYAPQKALSLKITSEVFHALPLYKNYGGYPANTTFGDFNVSYEHDLAQMIGTTKFFYTNNTTSKPAALDKLTEIAGWGTSPVVEYNGTGAYFLDKLEAGVWRLEVMPDAVWINDPFGNNSPNKKLAVVKWDTRSMTIKLPDLGTTFTVLGVNDGNTFTAAATDGNVNVSPGVYVLKRNGISSSFTGNSKYKNITVKEFAAPASTVNKTYVLHNPALEISTGSDYVIKATVVSPATDSVVVNVRNGWRNETIRMKQETGYTYTATVPAKMITEGFFSYTITTAAGDKFETFPTGVTGKPGDWDFYADAKYTVRVVPVASPVYIFNASVDTEFLSRGWSRNSILKPLSDPGRAELMINPEKLAITDPENKNSKPVYDYSMRFAFNKKTAGRRADLSTKQTLVFHGRALNDKPCVVQLALVLSDGAAYGATITIDTMEKDYRLSLRDLKNVKLVTLPRPYPSFLSYYFESSSRRDFDLSAVEVLQISIGPGIPEAQTHDKHGVAIESIRLE